MLEGLKRRYDEFQAKRTRAAVDRMHAEVAARRAAEKKAEADRLAAVGRSVAAGRNDRLYGNPAGMPRREAAPMTLGNTSAPAIRQVDARERQRLIDAQTEQATGGKPR